MGSPGLFCTAASPSVAARWSQGLNSQLRPSGRPASDEKPSGTCAAGGGSPLLPGPIAPMGGLWAPSLRSRLHPAGPAGGHCQDGVPGCATRRLASPAPTCPPGRSWASSPGERCPLAAAPGARPLPSRAAPSRGRRRDTRPSCDDLGMGREGGKLPQGQTRPSIQELLSQRPSAPRRASAQGTLELN